jgi:hypothetical protein
MPRNPHLIAIRNERLYKRWIELCDIKENGVQKLSFENIFKKLEQEFHITETRITRIIRKMQEEPPKPPTSVQPTLF